MEKHMFIQTTHLLTVLWNDSLAFSQENVWDAQRKSAMIWFLLRLFIFFCTVSFICLLSELRASKLGVIGTHILSEMPRDALSVLYENCRFYRMVSWAIVTSPNSFAFQRHDPGCTSEVMHLFLNTRGKVTYACYRMKYSLCNVPWYFQAEVPSCSYLIRRGVMKNQQFNMNKLHFSWSS